MDDQSLVQVRSHSSTATHSCRAYTSPDMFFGSAYAADGSGLLCITQRSHAGEASQSVQRILADRNKHEDGAMSVNRGRQLQLTDSHELMSLAASILKYLERVQLEKRQIAHDFALLQELRQQDALDLFTAQVGELAALEKLRQAELELSRLKATAKRVRRPWWLWKT